MLPKKAIIAVIVASLLLYGSKALGGDQAKTPNLLLGFTVVGALNAVREFKELLQPL